MILFVIEKENNMSNQITWEKAFQNVTDFSSHLNSRTCTKIMSLAAKSSFGAFLCMFSASIMLSRLVALDESQFSGLLEYRNLLIHGTFYFTVAFLFAYSNCRRNTWIGKRVPAKYDFGRKFRDKLSPSVKRTAIGVLSRIMLLITVSFWLCTMCLGYIPYYVLSVTNP